MAATQDFPDRKYELVSVTIIMTILSTYIAIWRLIVRFKINPRLGWSDYWMMVAVPLAFSAHIFAILGAYAGEGRVDADPFLTPEQRNKVRFLTFFAKCFNMYAMFFAKLSICAYLIALNFSRAYRITIWVSVVVVIICGFLIPFIGHWTVCKTPTLHFDPQHKIVCAPWTFQFRLWGAYLQVSTNVATDLVYAAAPIIYLRKVKLNRYTQWGVRGVFLCALIGTGLSLAKLVEFSRLQAATKKNDLYKSTTSSLLAVCENSVAIFVACLPPLRRTFDNLLKKILPDSLLTAIGASEPRSRNVTLPTYYTNRSKNREGDDMADDDSDRAILPEEEYVEDSNGRIILKTTKVTVVSSSAEEFGADGQRSDPK